MTPATPTPISTKAGCPNTAERGGLRVSHTANELPSGAAARRGAGDGKENKGKVPKGPRVRTEAEAEATEEDHLMLEKMLEKLGENKATLEKAEVTLKKRKLGAFALLKRMSKVKVELVEKEEAALVKADLEDAEALWDVEAMLKKEEAALEEAVVAVKEAEAALGENKTAVEAAIGEVERARKYLLG